MAKYKVGDKVVLRKDLVAWSESYSMEDGSAMDYASEEMVDLASSLTYATIENFSARREYQLIEDKDDWSWTDGMIAGLYKEPK